MTRKSSPELRKGNFSLSISPSELSSVDEIIKEDFNDNISISEYFLRLHHDYEKRRGSETLIPSLSDLLRYQNQTSDFINQDGGKERLVELTKLKNKLSNNVFKCDMRIKEITNPGGHLTIKEKKDRELAEALEKSQERRQGQPTPEVHKETHEPEQVSIFSSDEDKAYL